jgi:ABC-type transporter lipoprotein component MlaA
MASDTNHIDNYTLAREIYQNNENIQDNGKSLHAEDIPR